MRQPTAGANVSPEAEGLSDDEVRAALEWLKFHNSSKETLDGMARYAIPSDNALGVAMRDIKTLGKRLGLNHPLAMALWDTGVYEARMLAAFVGDPAHLTSEQMDQWCASFDNWAYCDTLSFNLFDRSPYASDKVTVWSGLSGEFQKRAAFALLWSLALHDTTSCDDQFVEGLRLIEGAAGDQRNFVKKSVDMALRAIGTRNRPLNNEAIKTAERLAASSDPTRRWIGRHALTELTVPRLRGK